MDNELHDKIHNLNDKKIEVQRTEELLKEKRETEDKAFTELIIYVEQKYGYLNSGK